MENCAHAPSPMDPNVVMTSFNESDTPFDTTLYQQAIGSLMWISTISRPDITTAVHIAARFSTKPAKRHWSFVQRILRYLRGTSHFGLKFTKGDGLKLLAYSDADYAGDRDTRKSTSGVLIFIGSNLVHWKSSLQPCISLSTLESEYIAAALCAQTILWARRFLSELNIGFDLSVATTLNMDNQAAISFSKDHNLSNRTKHIDVRYHFIRDHIQKRAIAPTFCPTDSNLADLLTKALPTPRFITLRDSLGIVPHATQHYKKEC